MPKKESKRRLRRRSKGYRRAMIAVNVTFIVIIILTLVFGCILSFTKKKMYRDNGIEYYNIGEYEAAIEEFDKALDCKQIFSDKIDVDICLYKADCYLKTENYLLANKTYKYIINNFSEKYYDIEQVEFLAELSYKLNEYKLGSYDLALNTLIEAVDKGYYEISLYVADCYEQKLDYANMLKYYDIYAEEFGLNSYLCYKYANYYISVDRQYKNALNYIDTGIGLEDKEYLQYLYYGEILCYEEMDNYEHAFNLAKQYISNYPNDLYGKDKYAYLKTRVEINEVPLNDRFELYIEQQ